MHPTRNGFAASAAAILVLLLASMAIGAPNTSAQQNPPNPWWLAMGPDGTLYLVTDKGYYEVTAGTMTDELLAGLPDLGPTGPVGPGGAGFGPPADLRPPANSAPNVSPTPVLPPAPTPTPVVDSPGAIIPLAQPWRGDGLTIAILETPGCCSVHIRVTNTSSSALNFQVPSNSFYIRLSTGETYYSIEQPAFNNFNPTDVREMYMVFQSDSWRQFETRIRDNRVDYYVVTATNFGQAVPLAQWRYDLKH